MYYLHMQLSEIETCRATELDYLYDWVQAKKDEESKKDGEENGDQPRA